MNKDIMKEAFKNQLIRALDQSVSLDIIQQNCREILRSMFENFDFVNNNLRRVVLELCNQEGFPIKYEIRNKYVAPNLSKTKPMVIYGILGLIGVSASILANRTDNSFLNILGGLVTLSSGIGAGYYYAKRKTPMSPQPYFVVVSTVDEIIGMIDFAHKNIMKLVELIPMDVTVSTEVNSEILQWFQQMYAKSCRDPEKKNQKEDIEDLILRLGYEFFYYTPNDMDCFDASNANIAEVCTTVPALRNSITNRVVLRGRVVFPL